MKHRFVLVFIVFFGVVLRIAYWLYTFQYVTTDISYWGLMAKYIAGGRYSPVWRYGTETIGAFFSYITAFIMPVLGVNVLGLSLVELVFSVLFVLSAYFVSKSLLGRRGGLISILLVSLAPFSLIKTATCPTGVYNIVLFLGNILFLLAIKIWNGNSGKRNLYIYPAREHPGCKPGDESADGMEQCSIGSAMSPRTGRSKRYHGRESVGLHAVFGFIGGFLFWIHLYSLCFLVPCFLFIMFKGKAKPNYKTIGRGIIFLGAFLIGSFPLWWFNLLNNLQTFRNIVLKEIGDVLVYNAVSILSLQLNNMLDIKTLFSFSTLLGVFYFTGFIYFCFRLSEKRFNSKNTLILLFAVVSIVVISRIDIIPNLDLHPALFLYAAFPYMAAYFAVEVAKKKKILSFAFIASIIILQLTECGLSAVRERKKNTNECRAWDKLFLELRSSNIHSVYTSLGLMPIIGFLTDEGIIASFYGKFKKPFYPYYADFVDSSDNPAVFLPLEDSEFFSENLEYICSDYKENIFGKYKLFRSFRCPVIKQKEVSPASWKAAANYNNKDAPLAFDRDVNTRWTTHRLQHRGMSFLLDLGEETIIDKIIIYLDSDINDRAMALKIEVSPDKENWQEVVNLRDNKNILFWSGPHIFWKNYGDRQEYYFNPIKARFIRLEQLGWRSDNYYYWSIRELFVYSPSGERGELNYDLGDLNLYLENKGFGDIYADYWLAANLSGDAEKISRNIDLFGNSVIITNKDTDVGDKLIEYDIFHKEDIAGDFLVYHSFRTKVHKLRAISKNDWAGSSNVQQQEAQKAFDNNLGTRWTTNRFQVPGDYFQIELGEEKYISGVKLWHKGSPHDGPGDIAIEVLGPDSQWHALDYSKDLSCCLYWTGFSIVTDSSRHNTYVFKPVKTKAMRCILQSSSGEYYWSIHEIDLLENIEYIE